MPNYALSLFLLTASLMLGGCAAASHNPQDPFEGFNRGMYRFNDAVDKAVIKPVARGYNTVVPAPGRMMVSNFFSNLDDAVVAVNDLLQLKIARAVSDCGRILVNSTVGLYGLVDVASHVGLVKHNEDFGQTLGVWGVGPGPYLVLPILGPSTVRDSFGDYADSYLGVSKNIDNVPTRNQLMAADKLDTRARLLNKEGVLDEAMIDPYSFIRDAYLQHRLSRVYDGNPPRKKYDDEEDDSPSGALPAAGDKQGGVLSAVPVVDRTSTQADDAQPSAAVTRIWVFRDTAQR